MIAWNIAFYSSSAIMLVTASALLFVRHPMHGAVYLIASLLALAIDFYLLGSPLMAAFQVILYIGAIMVLYVFFIMMNPLRQDESADRSGFFLPLILSVTLLAEGTYLIFAGDIPGESTEIVTIEPDSLGRVLFGEYKIAVEAISTFLLAALIAVMYLARPLMRNNELRKKLRKKE